MRIQAKYVFLLGLASAFMIQHHEAFAQRGVVLKAYGVQSDGERVSNIRIVREEVERTTLLPLLPYVFFERGSAVIPSRYVQLTPVEAGLFDVREFTTRTVSGSKSAITAYYNVLNIIGRRLTTFPKLAVTVHGGSSSDEEAAVAEQRAAAVIEYLESRFPSCKGRIRRGESNRSKVNETDVRFAEESRRVSFSADWEITRPVIIRDTTITITPPMLDFEIKSDVAKVNEVQLSVWQKDADTPLFNFIDVDIPQTAVRWDLENDPEHQPTADDILSAQTVVTDQDYKKFLSNVVQVPVDQYTLYRKKSGKVVGGKEIHQYNLILFDRNSSELRPDHIRIIDSIIADDGYVLPTSRVRVLGYADSTGTVEVNQSLSDQRARQAASRMSARFRDVITEANMEEVRGIGSEDVLQLPDGQSTPEARFYSRTVFIIISSEPSW